MYAVQADNRNGCTSGFSSFLFDVLAVGPFQTVLQG